MVTPLSVRVLSALAAVAVLLRADADLPLQVLAAVGTYALGVACWRLLDRFDDVPEQGVPLDLTGAERRRHDH